MLLSKSHITNPQREYLYALGQTKRQKAEEAKKQLFHGIPLKQLKFLKLEGQV